jgi:hypothetical protein
MESTLVLVTLLSLGLAGLMAVMVWRLVCEERRRSAARIEALAAEIERDEDGVRAGAAPVRPLATHRPQTAPWTPIPAGKATGPFASELVADPDLILDSQRAAEKDELFGIAQRSSSPMLRMAALGIAGMVVVAGIVAIMFAAGGSAGPAPSSAKAASAAAPALELISLSHSRKADTLTVSGLVRNPAEGVAVKQLAAVVFLFDRNGSFVTSGRAPVDFPNLAPGDETPFVVSVPASAAVGRYRVSFRTDSHVIPHVDRREPGGEASSAPPRSE